MTRIAALALLALLCTGPAAAQDYPFSGLFGTTEVGGTSGPNNLAICALSFIDQRADGSFVAYHVDKAQFDADGGLAYRIINTGTCTFDAATNIEACTIEAGFDATNPAITYYDVIVGLDADEVKIELFDDEQMALSAVATGKHSAVAISYFRCPFDEAKVRAALTADQTTLAREDLDALRFPFPELLQSPDVQALAAAVAP